MKTLAVVCIFGVTATLTVLAVAFTQWWPPLQPLWVGIGAIALPMLLAMAFLEPEFRQFNVVTIALSLAASMILGVALPGLWAKPEIRSAVAAHTTTRNVDLALGDENPSVQMVACHQTFALNLPVIDVLGLLEPHPQIAVECLGREDAGNIPEQMVARWGSTLNFGDSCELLEPIMSLGNVDPKAKAIEVLQCGVTAESDTVRACCLDSLSKLGKPEDYKAWISRMSFDVDQRGWLADLVLASHLQGDSVPKALMAKTASSGLSSPDVKAGILFAGCEAYLGTAKSAGLGGAMRWAIGEHTSCISEKSTLEVSPAVDEVCREYISNKPSLEAFCAANEQARLSRIAADEAVAQTQSSEELGALAGAINSGYNREAAVTIDDYLHAADQIQRGEKPRHFTATEREALRRDVARTRPNVRGKEDITSIVSQTQKRIAELEKNPDLKKLKEAKTKSEVDKIRQGFIEREKNAGGAPKSQ
jgi:hypothetical protein